MMDRRAFIGTAAVGALMLSSRANAQRGEKLPRVALVVNNIPVAELTDHHFSRAFVDGLRDLGLVEGRNIMIERRSAEGRYERLPSLMQELLALQVDVIVAIGPAAAAAIRATDTIPIVAMGNLMFELGGAASLARPGRNLTGLTLEVGTELMNGKRLQLLKEAAPKASRVAILGESSGPFCCVWRPATEAAAHALGLTPIWAVADTPEALEAAFAAIAKDRADALFVGTTAVNYGHLRRISELAARLRLPAVYDFREGPEAGLLMSYGANLADLYRRAARFVDKILKGAKPVFHKAAALPGKALHVALGLWYMKGLCRSATFPFKRKTAAAFGVSRCDLRCAHQLGGGSHPRRPPPGQVASGDGS